MALLSPLTGFFFQMGFYSFFFTGFHEGFLDITRFYWVLMGIYLMLVRFDGFWWAPLGLTRFY